MLNQPLTKVGWKIFYALMLIMRRLSKGLIGYDW